jgi:hypothetical protein
MKIYLEIEDTNLDVVWLLLQDLADAGMAHGITLKSILQKSTMYEEIRYVRMKKFLAQTEADARKELTSMGIKIKQPLDVLAEDYTGAIHDDLIVLDLIEKIKIEEEI